MKLFLNLSSENIDNFILTIALVIGGISLIWAIISRIRKELKEVKHTTKGDSIFRKAILPVTFLIIALALRLNLIEIFRDEEIINAAKDVLRIFIIFNIAWISINGVRIIRIFLFRRIDLNTKNNLKARKIMTQFRILSRIIVFIIIFVAIAFALMTFDSIRQLGISLFAGAGVAGIILGLAAQTVIGSILAGLQIAITQPIRLDDVVIVEGEWGWIEEITLTYVVVKIWDLRRLVLPTTYFIQKPFQNWTRTSADILGTVYIYTDYTMPVDKLRKAFLEIIKKTDLWDGKVANMQVTNATEKSLELRALMSAPDSPTAWDLRVHMREKILAYLQENFPENLPRTRVSMEAS